MSWSPYITPGPKINKKRSEDFVRLEILRGYFGERFYGNILEKGKVTLVSDIYTTT